MCSPFYIDLRAAAEAPDVESELVMVNYNYSALIFENVFLHVDEKVADMVSKQEKL